MKGRKIFSVIILILGVSFYLVGNYISEEVSHGQKKISTAQKSVDQGRGLTNLSPYTKDIGDMAADSVQKKIDEGRQEASHYQTLANFLHGSGIVLFIFGAGLLIFSFIDKKRV